MPVLRSGRLPINNKRKSRKLSPKKNRDIDSSFDTKYVSSQQDVKPEDKCETDSHTSEQSETGEENVIINDQPTPLCPYIQGMLIKSRIHVALVLAFISVLVGLSYMYATSRAAAAGTAAEQRCEVSSNPANDIKARSKDFIPEQPDLFWRLIESSVRSLERKPACVVLSPKESNSQARKAIKNLSDEMECILSGHHESHSLEGKDLTGNSRSALDEQLSKWFDKGHRVAVLYDMDRFSLETAKVFYKFCDDNEDPQYPRTILLMTISHKEEDNVKSKTWLDNQLAYHWSNIPDEISPLLSRVANRWTAFT
ncbi:uncharacterized protein [Watersipora subatra]|uniref:uncharacterized protein isoform X2 n=1 Tax=Watersipora subatra TaxID=2589382 RepID=UPI00355BED77